MSIRTYHQIFASISVVAVVSICLAGCNRSSQIALAPGCDDEENVPAVLESNEAEGFIQLCQGTDDDSMPAKLMQGVDNRTQRPGYEPGWRDSTCIPWEQFGFGEYVGPHRTPHVPEYRVRVNDQIEFVYLLTREQSNGPYRISVGDVIEVSSGTDPDINQTDIKVISDGTISLSLIGRVHVAGKTIPALQDELDEKYDEFLNEPAIVVRGLKTDTKLDDLRDSIDARAGRGGQAFSTTVSPDGTVQLPLVQSVPAVGLSLNELAREVNARYREKVQGMEVTPVLIERAPSFIYVLGEVGQAGRIQVDGPTTVMQAISQARGWNSGANLRQVIVFRRDANWRLMATRLDLSGALWGKRPHPSDEIWLRDLDIVLLPKSPIQRLADVVDLYFTQTIYGIFPLQNFDDAFRNSTIF